MNIDFLMTKLLKKSRVMIYIVTDGRIFKDTQHHFFYSDASYKKHGYVSVTEARDTEMSKLLGADSLWRFRMKIYISVRDVNNA